MDFIPSHTKSIILATYFNTILFQQTDPQYWFSCYKFLYYVDSANFHISFQKQISIITLYIEPAELEIHYIDDICILAISIENFADLNQDIVIRFGEIALATIKVLTLQFTSIKSICKHIWISLFPKTNSNQNVIALKKKFRLSYRKFHIRDLFFSTVSIRYGGHANYFCNALS